MREVFFSPPINAKKRNDSYSADQGLSTASHKQLSCMQYVVPKPTHLPPSPSFLIMQNLYPQCILTNVIIRIRSAKSLLVTFQ